MRTACRRLLLVVLALAAFAALPARAQGPAPAAPAAPNPAAVERAIGPWELSNPSGARKCALAFLPATAGPGHRLDFDAACRERFPPLAGVAAWSIAENGDILWLDREGRALFTFGETEVGVFEALRAGDPNVYFLTNLGLVGAALPQMEDLAGAWAIGRPTGRALCTVTLHPELAETAGALDQRFRLVVQPGCERSLQALGLHAWRIERELLVLVGRDGQTLSFKREGVRWTKSPADNRPLAMSRP